MEERNPEWANRNTVENAGSQYRKRQPGYRVWGSFMSFKENAHRQTSFTDNFRPFKQLIERLNRTFKESYRITCGYGTEDGAVHSVSLWVAYYNFLRPHEISGGKEPLNKVELLEVAGNMPGKWQLLIYLGQQAILKQQNNEAANCS